MLLLDDEVHEKCVIVPERCLRVELQKAGSTGERDTLLAGKGAYAHRKAQVCLQRAGDEYAAQYPSHDLPTDAADLEAAYRERILPRLLGNMMPVAMLRNSSFFGEASPQRHHAPLRAWHGCFDAMSAEPFDPEEVVERISDDLITALECAEAQDLPVPDSE